MNYDARYIAETYGTKSRRSTTPDAKGRFRINCPVHNGDGVNCLVWDNGNGEVLFKCETQGCASAAIAACFPELSSKGRQKRKAPAQTKANSNPNIINGESNNTPPDEEFKPKPHIEELKPKEISGPWIYYDAAGHECIEIRRHDRGNGKKDIYPYETHNGVRAKKAGTPSYGIGRKLKPLYNLPHLLDSTLPVLVVEGEKTCHGAMHVVRRPEVNWQCICTTFMGGKGRWKETDWSVIAGRDVTIWPDREKAEAKQADTAKEMNALAKHLHSLGCRVRIVDVSTVTPGYDLANPIDHVEGYLASAAAFDPDKLEQEDFFLPEITKKDLMAKEFPPIEWIVQDFIPQGVTLIAAPPKEGKTFLCEYLCDCMGGGRPWGEVPTKKQRILYIDAEQDEQLIQHRFKALNLENEESDLVFSAMPGLMFSDCPEKHIDRLTRQVVGRYDLVVFDTFGRLFEQPRTGGDAYEVARQRIQPLHEWAKKHSLNVFVVHHTNKAGGRSGEDVDAMDVITGSNALLSVVDCGLVIRKHRENEYKAYTKGRYFPGGVYSLKYNKPRWEFCGTFEEESTSETIRLILEYMRSAGCPCKAKEIADSTGLKQGTVSQNLKRMSEQKRNPLIRKVGYGEYEVVLTAEDDSHNVF